MEYSRLLLPDKDSYTNSGHPKKNYGHRHSLRVGSEDKDCFVSLIRFPISKLFRQIIIKHATMSLYLAKNHAPDIEKVVEVKRCLSNWRERKVSFKKLPIVDDHVAAQKIIRDEEETHITFDITNLAEKWYSGEYENYGIALSSGPTGLMKFCSRETPNSLYHPKIHVEYTLPPVTDCCYQFHEKSFRNLHTTDDCKTTPWILTKYTIDVSFLVINRGNNPALVRLEISPDTVNRFIDTEYPLTANNSHMYIPNFFLKFSRISYTSLNPGHPTTLDIFYQGR